ncbi:hypothetical protein MNB_SUP05-5-151 [hydrothermal vent metagenome]|uniref:COGs COG2929 n=1 Tax=hydrothermal vent metagenome TaxID=652676 RepID=A0A1W1CUF2_9ZZZZ
MDIVYDIEKNKKNIEKHNISFEEVINFDFKTASVIVDDRKDYKEVRYISYGFLDNRLMFLCYVIRNNKLRIVSFRKANKREVKEYEKTINK